MSTTASYGDLCSGCGRSRLNGSGYGNNAALEAENTKLREALKVAKEGFTKIILDSVVRHGVSEEENMRAQVAHQMRIAKDALAALKELEEK